MSIVLRVFNSHSVNHWGKNHKWYGWNESISDHAKISACESCASFGQRTIHAFANRNWDNVHNHKAIYSVICIVYSLLQLIMCGHYSISIVSQTRLRYDVELFIPSGGFNVALLKDRPETAYNVTIHCKSVKCIFRYMGSTFCPKSQRCPLKFDTKFRTYTAKNKLITRC